MSNQGASVIFHSKIAKAIGLILISIVLMQCSTSTTLESKDIKPNILLILADDMGYGDLECYGGIAKTPNLNQLATDGIRFSNFYAAAPNCSPSRVGLMTGISPSKMGMYSYRPPGSQMHLREEAVTIAEVLKAEKYQTAHIGKWHLGCLPQDPALNHPQPVDQGFDYSMGTENNAIPSHLNPVNFIRNGVRIGEQKGYSCQLLVDETEIWFENNYDPVDPFFMYVAFHEPHAVVASPPALVAKYSDYPQKRAEYLANVENLDIAVGRIINSLKERGLFENTMIIFASDNGSYRLDANGGLKAVKSFVYEGGIRVPGIIHWPALKRKGIEINEAAGFVDVLPTICEVLNVQTRDRDLDGTSMLPLLQNRPYKREKPLSWFFYRTSPEMSMRIGDHVILAAAMDTTPLTHRFSMPDMGYVRTMSFASYELYDLASDPIQENNLIDTHSNASYYKNAINQQLQDIQENGYKWETLPEASGNMKLKKEWVRY
ncbi:MAG: arylsulfatase A [Saprospiraceae bacterium]|jgi:arylsulfatase A